jgi:hypothetical protein
VNQTPARVTGAGMTLFFFFRRVVVLPWGRDKGRQRRVRKRVNNTVKKSQAERPEELPRVLGKVAEFSLSIPVLTSSLLAGKPR